MEIHPTNYIIRKFGSLDTILNDINKLGIPDYKIVGITLNCGNRHSISALCYGTDCDTKTFTVLNDLTRNVNNLLTGPFKFGDHCSSDINVIKIETILYEKNDVVSKIEIKINTDIPSIIKKRFPRVRLQIDLPKIHGGNINDIYYKKNLKYKEKYLSLKKFNL